MRVGARLASFGLILAATFAGAYAVGEAWPGDEPAPQEHPDQHDEMPTPPPTETHDGGHETGHSGATQP